MISQAHDNPIYTCRYINNDVLVTGDDNGQIKIWDLRAQNPVYTVHEQKDGTVTDLVVNEEKSLLFASSNNGTLGVYDIRKPENSKEKLHALSDEMEEELNCLANVRVE